MGYPWWKMLHLAAAAIWIGGMLVNGLAITFHAALTSGSAGARQTLAALRRWSRRVTTPAMLLAIAMGTTIALQGGWLVMSWLKLKLVLVAALLVLHGLTSRALRRMAADPPIAPPRALGLMAPATFFLALGIVVLAMTRLF